MHYRPFKDAHTWHQQLPKALSRRIRYRCFRRQSFTASQLASMATRLPSIPGSPHLERRQIARYEVSTEITFTSDNNFYSGFTENLSVGGLFVTSDKALPDTGTIVELTLRLPGADTDLRCTCEVRWHGTSQHGRRGYGVRFVSLSPEAESLIQNFIQHRKPLVHTGT